MMSHLSPVTYDVDFAHADIDINFAEATKEECRDGFIMHYEYFLISKVIEAEVLGFTKKNFLGYNNGESIMCDEEELLEV